MVQRNKKILQVIIHVAAWTGFLLLPFVNFWGPRDMPIHPERKWQWLFFITNVFLIGFYYLHSLVLIPRLLAARKTTAYLASILALLGFFIIIPYVYFTFVEMPMPTLTFSAGNTMPLQDHAGIPKVPGNMHGGRTGGRKIPPFAFPGTFMMFLLILIISGGIKIINQWFKSERRNEEIENEKISTELALLKSQVNPHFLFNTLNNIYALAVANSADTAMAVMKLSAIMRYVLEDTKAHLVPLSKEIQFLENYISLQRVRLTEKCTINFNVQGDTSEKMIAPLIFICFVENAFKYGVSTHQPGSIDIQLELTGQLLHFSVANKKHAPAMVAADNTGMGISNTRRRLALMYPERHQLVIENHPDNFFINLTIQLAWSAA